MTSEPPTHPVRDALRRLADHAARLASGIEPGAAPALEAPMDPREAALCLDMMRSADRTLQALEFILDPAERRRARAQVEEGLEAFSAKAPRENNPYGENASAPDPVAADRWEAGWLMGLHLEANPPPPGTERVTVVPGQTLRGMTYFEAVDYFLTPEFARDMIERGVVTPADPVQRALDRSAPRWRS